MDEYATVAGGWWLNQKCKFLSEDLRKEFEWHVAKLTVSYRKRGMDQSFLRTLQNSARRTAQQRECNSESEKIVIDTVILARRMNKALNNITYDPVRARDELRTNRFYGVSMAAAVEELCKFGPDKGRKTFMELVDALATKLPPTVVAKADEIRQRVRNAKPDCSSPRAEMMVLDGFTAAKALGVDLGVWSTEKGLLRP